VCLLFNYHEGYKGEQHFEAEGKGGGAIGYNIKKGEKTLCDEICPLHEDNLCHLNMMGFKEILYYDKQEAHHSLVAWA
jgi:hypothetical protein